MFSPAVAAVAFDPTVMDAMVKAPQHPRIRRIRLSICLLVGTPRQMLQHARRVASNVSAPRAMTLALLTIPTVGAIVHPL